MPYAFGTLTYLIVGLLMISAYYFAYKKANTQTNYYRPFRWTAGIIAGLVLTLEIARSTLWFLPHSGLFGLIIAASLNIMFLTLVFPKIEERFPFEWLRYFFHIGILLTVLVAVVVDFRPLGYSDFLPPTVGIFSFELVGLGGVLAIAFVASLLTRTPLPKPHRRTTARPDKIATYREAGLSEQEIIFFREQMAAAKEQILAIEHEFNRTAKLKAIETRHNTVKVAQNFFKELVQEPTQLSNASYFLYKLLPSLEDLLKKYNEINGHVAKNKQTYLILEKSGATIEQVCQQITDTYVQFHQNDYDEMLDEIQLASRNLTRTNKDTDTNENDAVNDLINDAFN